MTAPRLLVVGLGSMGRRRLRDARALGCEVAVCRRGPGDRDSGNGDAPDGIPVFAGLDAAAGWSPTHVVICTPTSAHADALRWAVEHGCHALVEKPLADGETPGLAELLEQARAAGLCVAVGCNLRFHPAVEAIRSAVVCGRLGRLLSVRAEVGQYLPDWHPGEDYRNGYAARREMGGGALLTLVHELDLVWWIAGPIASLTGVQQHVSDLELDVDDLAELVCRHASGVVSSVHMDFLDRSYNRRSRWVGSDATAEWIWGGPALLHLPGDRREQLWEDPGFSLESTYAAELADFLAASAAGREPRTPAADALGVLRAAGGVGS